MSETGERTVVLRSVPVALYIRTAAHHDALRRELMLLRASAEGDHLPPAFDRDLEDAAARFTLATQEVQQALLAASDRGEPYADVSCAIGARVAADAGALRSLLDEVDEYSRQGPLLTLAVPAELRTFRHWYLDQFIVQFDGAEPTAWWVDDVARQDQPVVVPRTAEGGTAVLSLHGDIDLLSAGDLRQALHDLRSEGHRAVVLDASDVTFLDSVGMSVLMVAARRLADDGGRLVVRDPSPSVRDALRMTSIDLLVEVQDRA